MKTVFDIQKEALAMVKDVYPNTNTIHIHFHTDTHYCNLRGGRESEPELKYRMYVTVSPIDEPSFEFSQESTSYEKLLLMLKAHITPMKELRELGITKN